MPQIIQITSEAIQAQIRRLLPSQQGFGIDMEASSVITPIIDVTPAAEGSQLPVSYQQAVSFGDATNVFVDATTSTILSTPGFYRLTGNATVRVTSSGPRAARVQINDGSTTKTMWSLFANAGITGEIIVSPLDLIVYLRTGDSLVGFTDTSAVLSGSVRQVADVYGNLTNPSGFTFE